ncbi:uncharacterized protein FIBRA_08056 [Fibroporia radiculosa]|uniref:Uncharacterized protein n=1 Tax=Fibroporia radiculosa TaxID=599839 RepID=J4I214_9APHY|nr:uncharacterized protein FIBRA_08056 [Fibroporia radiculosa]CCM05822.1 predicted protein [Fibroporia radiculosa]
MTSLEVAPGPISVQDGLQGALFGSSPRRRAPSNPKPISPGGSLAKTQDPLPKILPKTSSTRRQPHAGANVKRPDSPDLGTILANTPRPRRRSAAAVSPANRIRSRTSSIVGAPLNWKGKIEEGSSGLESTLGVGEDSDDNFRLGDDGSESDSSIDLHTPLPHLMFRDGLLSPRSKLLPKGLASVSSFPNLAEVEEEESGLDRSHSVLSVVSNAGSVMTKSGLLYKDPRDTTRRRLRHRDGHLLKQGMGLTTGLGWSDSEDEDAPSTLTRRLIQTSIARRPSTSLSSLSRPSSEFSRDSIVAASPFPILPSSRMASGPLQRSASVSFSSLRRPTAVGPPSSVDITPLRNRSVSSAHPGLTSLPRTTTNGNTASSSSGLPSMRRNSRLPKSAEMRDILSRHKAQPSLSGSTSSLASTASTTSAAPVPAESLSSQNIRAALAPNPSDELTYNRARTLSATSSMSTASVYSSTTSGSGSSTSTASGSGSTTSGIRPLRLPQAAAARLSGIGIVPPAGYSAPNQSGPHPTHRHTRTLSTSRSFSNALPKVSQPPSFTSISSPVSPTDFPLSSPSPSPSPSPRSRPLIAGPRPKPRTGTGMVYRTSSYSSLQGAAMRIRSPSVLSSSADGEVIF